MPRVYVANPGIGATIIGDYNGNGSVDAADYVLRRKNDGMQRL
jgi:hypothetical protein